MNGDDVSPDTTVYTASLEVKRFTERDQEVKEVDAATARAARKKFDEYLKRQRKKGVKIKVLERPYHKGLINVWCVLSIDGVKTRMFYSRREKRWKPA